MTDTASTLDRLVAQTGQLYTLPNVAVQVLQLTRNPQVDTRALKECIENDPAIASRVLRVVNSSLFGLSREVSDLNQALTLLGIKPLRLLVLGFSLPSGLFLDVEAKTLAWYWRHALTKAVAGREMSQRLWRIPGDDAFLAGLFQDLGALVLFQHLGQPYARFLNRAVAEHWDLPAAETQAMGFSHTTLSARLLAQWNFPETMVEAIGWRPDAPTEPPHALAQILHLAELIARLLADGQSAALGQLLQAGHRYSRVVEPHLDWLVGDMEEKVQQLADILNLQLPDGLEYRDVLAEAHCQMASITTEAAADLLRSRRFESPPHEDDWLFAELDDLNDALSALCAAPADAAAKSSKRQRTEPPSDPAPGKTSSAESTSSNAKTAAPAVAEHSVTSNPALLDRMAKAVAVCRQARRPLSLVLAAVGRTEGTAATPAALEFAAARQILGTACLKVEHPGAVCAAYGDRGFALILPGAERGEAIELGNTLIRTMQRIASVRSGNAQPPVKLDVGVATVPHPSKNFPVHDLLDGADRCLYGSHASGGGVVKSIEIY